MLSSRHLGGILLIIGTSIGGGMLALPVSTAETGFIGSIFFLVLCWLIMTSGALLVLEVNLRLPVGSNMVSMANATLGFPGKMLAWVTYLLLLYALLAGYISGGSDVFQHLFQQLSLSPPFWLTALLFTLFFGLVVYGGIRSVDYVNRGLMFGKLGIYCLLVLMIGPHIQLSALSGGSFFEIKKSLMILIASFGFASIVPTLREYFHDDIPGLKRIIVLGSLIPLLCYIVWNAVIMGVISRDGDNGLIALVSSEHTTSGLTNALRMCVGNPWIAGLFGFFTSICMLTAFLGVSIGLFDFLADGLSMKKKGKEGKGILALTFLPPLLIVLFQPGIYLKALSYAGVCCVMLLLLMPAIMAFKTRKEDDMKKDVLVPGGTVVLFLLIAVGVFLLSLAASEI